jgi:hypothetical protein
LEERRRGQYLGLLQPSSQIKDKGFGAKNDKNVSLIYRGVNYCGKAILCCKA